MTNEVLQMIPKELHDKVMYMTYRQFADLFQSLLDRVNETDKRIASLERAVVALTQPK